MIFFAHAGMVKSFVVPEVVATCVSGFGPIAVRKLSTVIFFVADALSSTIASKSASVSTSAAASSVSALILVSAMSYTPSLWK